MKNKNQIIKIKSHYIKLPVEALYIGLPSTALHILVFMLNCTEKTNPSLEMITQNTGLARSTITRALKTLQERNVIRLLKRGKGKATSEYEWLPRKDWRRLAPANAISVIKNKLMQKGKLTSGKELMSKRSGCPDGYVVTYIIPILHDEVCGLNVPWNMIYLTPKENKLKGNSFDGTQENNGWKQN